MPDGEAVRKSGMWNFVVFGERRGYVCAFGSRSETNAHTSPTEPKTAKFHPPRSAQLRRRAGAMRKYKKEGAYIWHAF